MSGLMDLVSQHLGSDQVDEIAKRLGRFASKRKVRLAWPSPHCWARLREKRTMNPMSKSYINRWPNITAAVLPANQLGGLLSGAGNSPQQAGSGIQALGGVDMGSLLGSILGGRQNKVEQGIGKASGLNVSQVGSLLAMLAPLVMGALSHKSKTENMDAGGLAGMFAVNANRSKIRLPVAFWQVCSIKMATAILTLAI